MLSSGRGRNDCKKALCAATKYMVVVAIVVALVTGILYLILGKSDIPVKDFEVRGGRQSLALPWRFWFGLVSFFFVLLWWRRWRWKRGGKGLPPPPLSFCLCLDVKKGSVARSLCLFPYSLTRLLCLLACFRRDRRDPRVLSSSHRRADKHGYTAISVTRFGHGVRRIKQ